MVECLFSTQTTRVQFPIGEKASLAQLVERCSCKAKAGSSTLPGGFARLAQWIERQTSNLEVAGSIPASGFFFWAYSVTVITRDSDSRNPGSNPGRP